MNSERDCDICYETKTDFINCIQCVNEVCLQCFTNLTQEVCPFCKHPFVENAPNPQPQPPQPQPPALDDDSFIIRGVLPRPFPIQLWLFCSNTAEIQNIIRHQTAYWTPEQVYVAYIRIMNAIRHCERHISTERHLHAETGRRRAYLMKLPRTTLIGMVRNTGGRGYSNQTKEQLVNRLI